MARAAGRALWLLIALGTAASARPDLKALRLDLAVPDIPAFSAIGVSPSTVSRPGNAKELALALGNGLNKQGEIQSGLAVEVAPFKVASLYTEAFNADALKTYVWPVRLSLATNAAIQGTDTLTQVAAGLRWSILGYDPQADTSLASCLDAALPPPKPVFKGGKISTSETPTHVTEEIPLETLGLCRSAHRAAHLANTTLEVSFVHVMASLNDPRALALRTAQDSLWITFSFGANTFGGALSQLAKEPATMPTKLKDMGNDIRGAIGVEPTAHVRVDWLAVAGGAARQVNLTAAIRAPIRLDGSSYFLELGAQITDANSVVAPRTVKVPAGIGGEFRLNNGMWLGAFFGGNLADMSIFALSNLKWSFGESRPYE